MRSGVNEDLLGDEATDATVITVHGGFANGGETMAARKRHVNEAEVVVIGTANPKYMLSLILCSLKRQP